MLALPIRSGTILSRIANTKKISGRVRHNRSCRDHDLLFCHVRRNSLRRDGDHDHDDDRDRRSRNHRDYGRDRAHDRDRRNRSRHDRDHDRQNGYDRERFLPVSLHVRKQLLR